MATERGQLWRVDGEGVWGDGGGVVTFYVLTDDAETLPDPHAAYRVLNDRDGGLYQIDAVQRAGGVRGSKPFGDGVHDQRTSVVLPSDRFE